MRILFLNNFCYLRGGSERVLFEEMRMLKEAGHEVAVFSRANPQNASSAYDRYFPPEIHTERVQLSAGALGTVKELIYSNTARLCLRKVLAEFNPDIAHAHNIYGRLTTSVLDELHSNGIPTIMTLHDLKLICPSYLMLNKGSVCEECKGGRYYRAVINKCHKDSYVASAVYALESWLNHTLKRYDSIRYFVSPSRFLREKCIEFGLPPDKIVYLPNFIDANTVETTVQPGKYLLYVGRLSREKGVKTLLGAMGKLQNSISLYIVGDGPERANLERFTSQSQIDVSFAGHMKGTLLNEAFNHAKAVVMPSECYENAPLTILEAFAHGKPVVGARIGGIPEMIDDGVDGYLFEAGDVDDLRSKIEQVMNLKDEECVQLGNAGREKVLRSFSAEVHYYQLMATYRKTLN